MLPVGLYGVAVYAVNEGVVAYLCVNAVGSDWECEGRPPETRAWRYIAQCVLRRVAPAAHFILSPRTATATTEQSLKRS